MTRKNIKKTIDIYSINDTDIEYAISFLQEKQIELKEQGFDSINLDIGTTYHDNELYINLEASKLEPEDEYQDRLKKEKEHNERQKQLALEVLEYSRKRKEETEYQTYLTLKDKYENTR